MLIIHTCSISVDFIRLQKIERLEEMEGEERQRGTNTSN